MVQAADKTHMNTITRWPDGRFRARSSWQPELLEILWQECSSRNISPLQFLEVIPGLGWPQEDLVLAEELWAAECADKALA